MMFNKNFEYYLSLRYEIVLKPEADGWSASIPELPGCIGAGDTIAEALEMLQDAKHSWMEASLLKDLPIPEPSNNYSDSHNG
ncbi:MAG: type II toxin-antitoxin system HicB family antitoxin [Anaerolineae bacterium]|nr:type II toxin-antitoxin system HicB family antitoxin [Anaerolineae bacterium]